MDSTPLEKLGHTVVRCLWLTLDETGDCEIRFQHPEDDIPRISRVGGQSLRGNKPEWLDHRVSQGVQGAQDAACHSLRPEPNQVVLPVEKYKVLFVRPSDREWAPRGHLCHRLSRTSQGIIIRLWK